ncbi:outer envelope pore protein 16-4, chloroplastic-like isoform X3 [Malus sylvestris]|uniref:outer envelope pore protein 16-4, chloroplastic-like isoform X3 n=1 Tax=Malus sylvestris TaxID=3752 RepID=UPI0010AAF62C|nr:outer envelope pore protein 16-4, chloroplastic-like isoform X3 [Malus domestica]XP_050138400.1 outer envelope pore protein 16-4, chloroplastic-like isoform X3 [Malus sylvestris]
MEGEPYDVVPCSSVAVDSILRIGTAGVIWGLCSGPHDARKQGLTGAAQAAFVARSAGACGVQYGLVAGICTVTHCGLQRYRGKSDWVSEWFGCWCSSRGSHCCYDTKLDAGDSYGLSGVCFQSCH